MALRDVGPWLLENRSFSERMELLTADMVCAELGPNLARVGNLCGLEHDWRNLLLGASALSASMEGRCQAAALRIAHGCIASSDTSEERKNAAALILDNLANQPAIDLAVKRDLLHRDFHKRLPLPARIEWMRRAIGNSIPVAESIFLRVNRFQRQFWETAKSNDWLSVSAPTSAGKSFILGRWITEFVRQHSRAILVYLVPTRALISEVERSLVDLFRADGITAVNISSLPLPRSISTMATNIFVFTQERLHLLLTAAPALAVQALIVDEAHKVGDRQRGVLLQHVIERVAQDNPDLSVIFASPMTSNPETLLLDAGKDRRSAAFASDDVTVNQNLIWVSQVARQPRVWEASLCLDGKLLVLGRIALAKLPTPETKRLPFIAHAIGSHQSGNIIYVNGAADAEKTATQLYDLMGPDAELQDSAISELIDLVRRTVHEEFLLQKVLSRGIAFHYGNLPLLIRNEIERLFSLGVIRYLICTSTLVEGVNMACRNIFLRGPRKGKGNPMSPEDFWNLAGRAGRWGKEFQGNIFCIDATRTDVWGEDGPPKVRTRGKIIRTTDSVMSDGAALIEFIANDAPVGVARQRPELEYVFSYLMSIFAQQQTIRNSMWAQRYSNRQLAALDEALAAASERIETPFEVIERNPGINPFGMDALLAEFRSRTKPIEDLLPAHPASDDALHVYTRIFSLLSRHTSPKLGPEGPRAFMLALLVTRWMRGFPLSRLISERLRRNPGGNTAAAIRQVMEDVEQIARFEAPKGLNCYRDLLRYYLDQIGRADLIAQIPDISILLEFGVSQQTQLSLISLGASRTTAIALSEIIAADDLTAMGAIEWLGSNMRLWRESDLPVLVKKEIELIFSSRAAAK